MDKSQTPPLVHWSGWLYTQLLRSYPRSFRQTYGAQVAQLFRDLCRETYRQAGPAGILRLWRHSVGDLLVNGLGEYRAHLRRRLSAPTGESFPQEPPGQVVFAQGTRWGLRAGVALVLLILVSNFVIGEQDDMGSVLLGYSLAFLACGLAGFAAGRRAAPLPTGVLTGSFTGIIIAGVVTLTYTTMDAFFFNMLTARPERVAAFLASGFATMQEYVFATAIAGGMLLLLFAVIFGALFGMLGAALGALRLAR